MKDPKKEFTKRAKSGREALGYTQGFLEQKAELPKGTVAQYEQGTRWPGIDNLVRISRALQVRTDYLLGLSDY